MIDEYEVDTTGTEEEAIEREWKRAQARQLVSLWHVVAPLVRTVVALVVAMGAKSVREALARAKALFAPVDVAQEAETLLAAIRSAYEPEEVRDAVTPFVEDRVRLAREVDGLRAEIESLTRGVTHHMTVAAIHRAEIARLTAARDNLQAEVSMLVGGLNDIFGKGAHPAPREALEQVSGLVRRLRAAAPGEAWERLREWVSQERGKAEAEHGKARIKAVDKLIAFAVQEAFRAVDERMAALAAVEPAARRGALIDRDLNGHLNDAERAELAALEERAAAWCRLTAPPAPGVARLRAILAAAPDGLDAQQTAAVREIVARLDVPTPPRALTEAEARALWEHECQRAAATGKNVDDVVTEALMNLSRGDVPPEVRPGSAHDLAASDGPHCACGMPSAHESGWCGREICLPADYTARRAADAGGHGRAAPVPEMAVTTGEDVPWTPRPGARTITDPFVVQAERRAAAGEIVRQCGERDFVVMHDDGTQAHYDADELGPEPAAIARPKSTRDDPICACGARLSEHDAAGQYDPCPGGGGQFRDPPPGVHSVAGPAGLGLARKAGGSQ